MKRRDLEPHLRKQGCRKIDEGGNHTRWAGTGWVRPQRDAAPSGIDYRLAREICKQLGVRRQTAAAVARARSMVP